MRTRFPLLFAVLLLGLATVVVSQQAAPKAQAPPLKIVFLHGGRSHGPGAHEFKAGSHLLANCLREQSAVPVEATVIAGWPQDPAVLEDADSIVIYCDATKVTRHGWETLDRPSRKGTGIMLLHYAIHPKVSEGERYFLPWVGGYFHNDDSVNPIWLADLKTLEGHPTSRGVGEIHAIGEFYYNLTYHPEALPLGTAVPTKENLVRINNLWRPGGEASLGKPQAILWGYERPGGGRGAGFSGGHFHQNWAFDEYRQLILNTVVWTAGGAIPAEGIPVRPLTEDELNENLDDYGRWQVEKTILPVVPKEGEPVPRAVLVDALGIADAFLQAALRQDFEVAKSFVDGEQVSDATIAGLCIVFEEGRYRMRKKHPLRGLFNRDTTAGFLANVEDSEGAKAAQFGVNLQREQAGSPWQVVEVNLDQLLADYADRVAGGDVYYTPLIKNPNGGDTLVLYFDFDQDALEKRSERQLEIVTLRLQTDPEKKIRISGHTDAVGTEDYNQTLSLKRAEAVKRFLIESGVAPGQILTEALGKNRPRRPNLTDTGEDNPTGRRANRRAEIYLDF